jgi:hypothetical protein
MTTSAGATAEDGSRRILAKIHALLGAEAQVGQRVRLFDTYLALDVNRLGDIND